MTAEVIHVTRQGEQVDHMIDIGPLLLLAVAAFLAWLFLRIKNKRRGK